MTDKKITDLTTATALDGTELYECVQGGANKKTDLTDVVLKGGPTRVIGPVPDIFDTSLAISAYSDSGIYGWASDRSVRAVSVAEIAIGTYYNGAGNDGVGATLTNSGAQVALVLDGVSLVVLDRVLLIGGVNLAYAGLYEVTVVGDDSTNWVLTRTTDFDTPSKVNAIGNALTRQGIFITEGTTYKNTIAFLQQAVNTIGVDHFNFAGTRNLNGVVFRDSGTKSEHNPGQIYVADGNSVLQPSTVGLNLSIFGGSGYILPNNVYVDTEVLGFTGGIINTANAPKNVRVVTTQNFSTPVYNNGTDGVGATLTNGDIQAALVIDSITMLVNDRVLVSANTDPIQNGIYIVTDVGSDSTDWILTRATDYDTPTKMNSDLVTDGWNIIQSTEGTFATKVFWLSSHITTIGTNIIGFFQSTNLNGYVPRDGNSPGAVYAADANGILQPIVGFNSSGPNIYTTFTIVNGIITAAS